MLARLRTLKHDDADGWVFRAKNGEPVNPGNALKRYVRPAIRKLKLKIGGWHDFRHTLTTRLLGLGWSPKVVSEICGHSDVHTTLQIYHHPTVEDFRAPLQEMSDELLADVSNSVIVN